MTGTGLAQAAPRLTIADVGGNEGNRGTSSVRFVVTLSAASTQPVTVQYSTANDTATAGQDYTAQTSKTLTFEPGDTTESFPIEITGDTTDEPNEKFFVNLNNPTNATIGDGQAVGTIVDDDGSAAGPTPSPSASPSPAPSPSVSPAPSPAPSVSPPPVPAPVTPSPTAPPAPNPSPTPAGSGLATTGNSESTALAAFAMLMMVVGFMLRRSFGDED